ncbi:MAG: hypothetical protein P1P89_08680 [Desulfobacterales bacterium]|nr:hypothetical protein [Desulfobacterales bacterium]
MLKRWTVRLLIAVVIGLVAWWTLAGLQKQIMIPFAGNPIIADNIRYVDDKILYQRGGREWWVALTDINEIVQGSWAAPSCYRPLLTAHFHDTLKWLTTSAGSVSGPASVLRGIAGRIGSLLPEIAGVLIFGLLAFVGIKRGRLFFVKKVKPGVKAESRPDGHLPQLAGFMDVATLFLDLYRETIGAPPDAPVKIESVEESDSDNRGVYELKIEIDGSWRSRRMAIAAIGENTGSKSQCFYVIFDTHMVVKIPPVPITDFQDYIERIQAEAKIRRKLVPKECVIPNISVILKKIHPLPEAAKLSDDHIEAGYTRWLLQSPANQRFLKVGDSFAFFMDLAKSYFLSRVAKDFHRTETLIADEVQADTDILTDQIQFEAKYGKPGADLWPDLHQAFTTFQEEIGAAGPRSDGAVDLSEWQTKNLYLCRMAGREIALAPPDGLDRKRPALETHLAKFRSAHIATGRRYRQLLLSYTSDRLFDRNQPIMCAMAANLLALLAWMGENRVAMRDLKPDNLLVAGNPADYPQFLSSAQNYSIGLIDLETAVDYERKSRASLPQPRLGGTPFYGTPSHFFPNHLLQQIHEDLPLVFHLQDWYAIIGIIYEIITDERLFGRTAREFPKLINTVMQTLAQNGDLEPAYIQFSRSFWESSGTEFQQRLVLSARPLEAVVVGIPEPIQLRLAEHIALERSKADDRIIQCLDANPAFNKGNNRRLLEKSPAQDLERIRARYDGRANSRDLVCRMDELMACKRLAEKLAGLSKTLQTPFPQVTVMTLLQMMFDVVHTQMLEGVTVEVLEKVPGEVAFPDKTAEPLDRTVQMEETIEDGGTAPQGLGYSVTMAIQ